MPKCPTCGKPAQWQDNPSRPFCSERCKLIDFGRWSNGEYRVAGKSINPSDIAELPQPDQASGDEDENGD